MALLLFTLSALACGGSTYLPIGHGDRLSYLPSLTSTRLPTLTPTAMPAISAEVSAALPATTIADTPAQAEPLSPIPVNAVDQPQEELSVAANPEAVALATQAPAAFPTETPSPFSTVTPLSTETPAPTDTATPVPSATPMPTETPLPKDWVFVGLQTYTDPYQNGLLLYGDLMNNTGVAQELQAIKGDFYDGQGAVIAAADIVYAYWPGYVIPAGGSMPFEILVEGIQAAADFALKVEAEPSSETPRQDFEFSDLSQHSNNEAYCLQGRLKNPGDKLGDYLIVAATLYDNQDNVLKFGEYEEFGRARLVGNESSTFEICVETPQQQGVARYQLQAWGR